jgi:hypothetical protein
MSLSKLALGVNGGLAHIPSTAEISQGFSGLTTDEKVSLALKLRENALL